MPCSRKESSHLNQGKKRAVFLDRDGVINEILFHQEMGVLETPFTVAQFRLKPHVASSIRRLKKLGFRVIVVSNQPGVAMGHFSLKTLCAITHKMIRQLKQQRAYLDGIYYCLHHPKKGNGRLKRQCQCRKPRPGLLLRAARDLKVDLRKSYMVGDSILDVEAGRQAGCKTFLLAHAKCDLCSLMNRRGIRPHYQVADLSEVPNRICRIEKKKR